MNLYTETMELLKRPGVNITRTARELGVSSRWLFLLKADKIKDPGVHMIQRLHDHLQ